ncbi:MAG: transposase, partial [Elusimicrobia bacterium CG_4_10_14_0_2_um_filter_63_34]
MYIHAVPNRNSPPAILLREGYREKGKTRNRTLANLSKWPKEKVEMLRLLLRGEKLAPVADQFEAISSWHHGHIDAVLRTMNRLGFDQLIATTRSRERDLVMGMVAARILAPESKLATTRWWHTTTLPAELGIADADENDLYDA